MRPYAKSAATVVGVGMVAALCVPLTPATAAPSAEGPGGGSAAGRWTKPATIAKGGIAEVLAPPGYGSIYDETRFVWRKGSTLSIRMLRAGKEDVASGVTAAAASPTALAWHQKQGSDEGVHLRVYRTIGSSGGDPGWTESRPMLVPDTYDSAATPSLAVADDLQALASAVVYSRTTPQGVQLEAAAFSTGSSASTEVTLGASQVLAAPGGSLDELEAAHSGKLIAVAYRRTAADGATSVALRTSPVTDTLNELTWGPEQVVCQAPAGAAVACGEATFGLNKRKKMHLFLRGPDGLQHRTVLASGASEPVVLGPATGAIAVMDAAYFSTLGRKTSTVDLSVAAAHGDRTTVWRIRDAGPAVATTVRTPGARLLALGQHGSGRMLAWSNGTGVGTWSDDRGAAVTRVASEVSRVTQLGLSGGLAPRVWYVAGAGQSQRLATTLLDQRAPLVYRFRYRVVKLKSGRMKVTYGFANSDEAGLARTVVQMRSGPAARNMGKWRTLKTIRHRGKFYGFHRSSFPAKRGFRYCMRVRSIDVVGHRSAWKLPRSGGKTDCLTATRR